MAAKKKANSSASEANTTIEAPPSIDNALIPTNGNNNTEDNSEDFEV